MTEKESDKTSGDDSISQEEWERLPPSPPDLPVPAWLAAYQGQFPDLDFSRYSLDRIMCIRDFLMRRFNEAADRNDGDLLSDPDVANAIWLMYDEPTRFVRAMFEWRDRPVRYGGDFERDLKVIKDDLFSDYYEGPNCEAMPRWFNLIFWFIGSAIARWLTCTNKLDTSPLFATLKNRIATLPLMDEGDGMLFPEPYGVEHPVDKYTPPEAYDLYGFCGVKCVDPALGQLVLLARGESSRPKRDIPAQGRIGRWASQFVSEYDPVHFKLKFLNTPIDFSRSPRRWEHVQAVVESEEPDGAVRLGDWMGRWQTASDPVRNFSRCIRRVDRAESGWYHLTDKPRPEAPTRQKCKRFAQRGG